MVEVVSGQLGVGIGNGVVFFRCRHDGIELRAVQRPTNRDELCQFSLRGAKQDIAHHRQHLVAVHIPSGSQAAGQIAGRQRACIVPQVAVGHLGQGVTAIHIPVVSAQFIDHILRIAMADASVMDFLPAYAFVGIVICAVAGITPCTIAIPLIAESSVIHVVIISVFQAIGYVVIISACPADECSDVGCSTGCSIVLGANGTVEQTVVDGDR